MEKNWWEDLSDEEIEALKSNGVVFALCIDWKQEAFRMMPTSDRRQFWLDRWRLDLDPIEGCYAYRLRPDWQRPEQKEEGHWIYSDVYEDGGYLSFHWGVGGSLWLSHARSIKGFGGIEFREWVGSWYPHIMFFYGDNKRPIFCSNQDTEEGLPAHPIRVRFWKDSEK